MFVTEGPLHPESRLFVGRSAELRQMEAWLPTVRCVGAVLGARQTGKTSLLLRLRHLLKGKYAFVFIDLEGVAGADLGDSVAYIASEMISQLREQIGQAEFSLPTKPNEFLLFLEQFARAIHSVRVVVLLDEIGALSTDTSFRLTSAIRAVFTSRHVKAEFARYVFVVAGAIDALDVTTGRNSPLKNVAETLYLEDLSAIETTQLVAEMFHDSGSPADSSLSRKLHDWTNGHPYWTQRLAKMVHHDTGQLTDSTLHGAVEQLLRIEDRNLPYIFHALDADRTLRQLATAMVGGTSIAFSRANGAIAKLELIGVLKNDRGRCAIRNRIYREALDREPIRRAVMPARDLRQFTAHLHEVADLETLLQAATLSLQAVVQSRFVVGLSARPLGDGLEVVSSIGPSGAIAGTRFEPSKAFLSAITTPFSPFTTALLEHEADWFRKLAAAAILSVNLKGSVAALFCIGPKLSGDDYDDEEKAFLSGASQQIGSAIEHLQLRTLEKDVRKAWEIQRDLLPASLPEIDGFQIAGICQPARIVSGDYYDAYQLSSNVVALCVGDVVGKGMPAALLMSNLQATVKALSSESVTPSQLCIAVNRAIARNVSPGEFITFFYALLDTSARTIRYTNAGHNAPIVVRATGEIVRLEVGGPVLGIFPERTYDDHTLPFNAGDRLLLFTDGVTEALNGNREEFGDGRLIDLVRSGLDAETLLRSTLDTLLRFTNGLFHDDVTMLAVTCAR